jgi:hypothetical protein
VWWWTDGCSGHFPLEELHVVWEYARQRVVCGGEDSEERMRWGPGYVFEIDGASYPSDSHVGVLRMPARE